jgi:3-dehydroquinate dehydratase II
MKLLLIQGANMEYLGRRQPELYGTTTAKELDAMLRRQARRLDVALEIFYTNTEGEAVSAIYKADRAKIDGILFNLAGFGVDSYWLALEAMVARLRQRANEP